MDQNKDRNDFVVKIYLKLQFLKARGIIVDHRKVAR